MGWLDKLIDFLIDNSPIQVVNPDERGLYILCGRWARVLRPRLYLVCPIIEKIEAKTVTPTTLGFGPQSLMTSDHRDVNVSGDIEYRIVDLKKFLLENYNSRESARLRIHEAVAAAVLACTVDDLNSDKLHKAIQKAMAHTAKVRWGIEITGIAVRDVSKHRAIRLIEAYDEI